MERLTRQCEDTENGKFLPYVVENYTGIFPNCTLGRVVERLAYYENLVAQGRLIVLGIEDACPCANCGTGWANISSEGYHGCEKTCERLREYANMLNGSYCD